LKRLPALELCGIAILVLTAVGTAGFHYIEHWSWFNSFYMVVITFSTLGGGDSGLSHRGKVFYIYLIIAGVAVVFLMIGALTQALLEFELSKVFGRRRMEREIANLKDHYIICGAGRVGSSVALELSRKPQRPFVIIENNEKSLTELDPKWLAMVGDAASEKTLREAGIERAKGLVAATTTDATNIYIVLTAKSIKSNVKIIARASEERAEKHLKTAGADMVISPYVAAGHRIAQSFLRPNVVDFLDLATTRSGTPKLLIEEILVTKQSPLAGTTIGASGIHHQFGIMILAIRGSGDETRFNPRAHDLIHAGDYLIAMGEPIQLAKLEAMTTQAVSSPL
jgi:voltage-gated potassium channel